jgi:ribose/xylose/arabinose/galactoside ABC-type transport system permease subunit
MSTGSRIANIADIGRTQLALKLLDNAIWPILVLTFVAFSLLVPQIFSSADNIQFILLTSAPLGVLVLAEGVCLISGNFDLSIASIAGFSAMFTAVFTTQWFPGTGPFVAILLCLAVGGVIGLVNGFMIGYVGVNPFLQTLVFLIVFRELMPILSTLSISDFPSTYTYIGGGELAGIPVAIFVLLGCFLLLWFLLKYTKWGMAVYAVGGDEQSAEEAGIDSSRIVLSVFVISGLLSGLAGLLYTGYLGAVTVNLADGQVFSAFAGAVIGGISIFGGRGNILGALGGVLLLSTIQAGLVMMAIPSQWVKVINGLILGIAVLLYTARAGLRERVLAKS